jgi:hypothetical protein
MQDIPNLFTKDELVKLIKDSDGFKSPGLDGTPYGLYQLEPDLFADFLIQQYNDVWSEYMAPPQGWSRSIITTLFKGGSLPLDEISSRRPISLLDTDYKLFGKLVATRLQAALTNGTVAQWFSFWLSLGRLGFESWWVHKPLAASVRCELFV